MLSGPDEIGLVDFGLVGRLSDEDMGRLTRLFIDAASENVDAMSQRISDLGVRCPPEHEQKLRSRCGSFITATTGRAWPRSIPAGDP